MFFSTNANTDWTTTLILMSKILLITASTGFYSYL